MRQRIYLLLLFCSIGLAAFAQKNVKGIVTSTEGEALIGAYVTVKGTTTGVVTDIDGSYSVKVTDDEAVLIFSYTGFVTQEITVGQRIEIDVILAENISTLEQVVVVGYGSQKRSNISGAVSVVTADELTEAPALRVEQALQGRTAGVQIAQNSGSPGSALTVRIRGVGTINNADPLYIVDGIPVDGLDFLNPNDIESVNVLKDAASSAIYGARGANGVVLITTKGGKINQDGNVSYETYYGVQSPWKKLNLLTAEEYAIISNEMHINAGKVPLPEFANPSALGTGTDWQDAIFENAPIQNHQLSFSGGTDRSAYTLSGTYFAQDGIVGGDKSGFERYTARFNMTNQLKEWLSVGSRIGFTNLSRNFLPENNEFVTPVVRALNIDPVTPVRKPDGTYAYSRYADTDITNPVNAIEQINDRWKSNRVVAGTFVEAKFLENFTAKSTLSVDATFASRKGFIPRFNLSNDTLINDAPAGEISLVNTVTRGNNIWQTLQWENVINYDKTIGDIHHITATVGNTVLRNKAEWYGGANTNLPSNNPADAYISNTVDPIESQSAYEGATESAMNSYFGRVNYEYADKYLLTATLRADGSSRFGANNKFGYFPSFSAAWIASREEFWTLDMITFLKVRASWGQNGNDRIGDFSFNTIVSNGQNYTFGQDERITNGAVALSPGNPDLRWETSEQTNIGVDAEFYDGKINFTGDYYIKRTLDMLAAPPIPLHVGAAFPPTQNIGSVRNSGIELAVDHRNTVNGIKYSVGANIAFVSTEVISLGEGSEPISTGRVQSANANVSRTEVGFPIGGFYGYVTDGLFQSVEEVAGHAFQSESTQPGDIRFKDLNNDGVINELDQEFIGNPTPNFTYGVTADAAYKGFDFSMFIQGSQGNDIYNATTRYDFTYVNRPNTVLNRWTGPGTSDSEPRVSLTDPNQNARVSDRFVEDGSYVRLKNIQLGYTLPSNTFGSLNIQKVRVYISAQNLFTFTNYSGLDPEIGAINALEIGIDRGFYPQARTILGGLSVVF